MDERSSWIVLYCIVGVQATLQTHEYHHHYCRSRRMAVSSSVMMRVRLRYENVAQVTLTGDMI